MGSLKKCTPTCCPERGDEVITGTQPRCAYAEGPAVWEPQNLLFTKSYTVVFCVADPTNPPIFNDGVSDCPIVKDLTLSFDACPEWGANIICTTPTITLNSGDTAYILYNEPCIEEFDSINTNPSISISKEVNQTLFEEGDVLVYTLTVTNTGDEVLNNVTISDAKLGLMNVAVSPSTLNPNQSTTFTANYTATTADFDAKRIDNLATASGVGQDSGTTVSGNDTATIDACPAETFFDAASNGVTVNGITVTVVEGVEGTATTSGVLPDWLHTINRETLDNVLAQGWQDYIWNRVNFSSPVTPGNFFTVFDMDAEAADGLSGPDPNRDTVAVVGFNGTTLVTPVGFTPGSGVVSAGNINVVNTPPGYTLPAALPSYSSASTMDQSSSDADYSLNIDFGSQQVTDVMILYATDVENTNAERRSQGVRMLGNDPLQNIPELACDKGI